MTRMNDGHRALPLTAILESAPDAVVGIDATGRIVFANLQISALFGYDPDELIGQPVEALLPTRFHEAHRAHRARYLTDPVTRPMGAGLELAGRRRDGTEFPVDISLSAIDTANGLIATAFVRDLTDRKRTEAMFRGLLDGAADAIVVIDASGAITLVNQQVHALLGYTVVVADDTPDMRLVLRLALSEDSGFCVVGEAGDGRAAVEQARVHQPDVVVLDLAMPVMDGLKATPMIRQASPGSRVVVLSGYGAEDMQELALAAGADAYVTKGRPTESLGMLLRELVPAKAAALLPRRRQEPDEGIDADRDAVTDLALSVTAHELATPVTVTLGMLDQLRGRMDTLPSTVVDEMMAAVERNVRHISDLLTLLNDVRHIGREALVLDRTHLDLPTLVRETLRDLTPALADRAVTVNAPGHIPVSADPVRIRQVLTNLVTNAVKFSPPGTPIDITITPLLGTVELIVTDHGTGITDEQRPRLFTKFTRLGADTSGMGLGLYLSRGIARAHGGELRLALSNPDGSAFALELVPFIDREPLGEDSREELRVRNSIRISCCICATETADAIDYVEMSLEADYTDGFQLLGAHAACPNGVLHDGYDVEVHLFVGTVGFDDDSDDGFVTMIHPE